MKKAILIGVCTMLLSAFSFPTMADVVPDGLAPAVYVQDVTYGPAYRVDLASTDGITENCVTCHLDVTPKDTQLRTMHTQPASQKVSLNTFDWRLSRTNL